MMIKLNYSNYQYRKPRVEDLLYHKDFFFYPIKVEATKLINKTNPNWNKINKKNVDLVRQCIDGSIFHHGSTETDAHELWMKLVGLYEHKMAQNKPILVSMLGI